MALNGNNGTLFVARVGDANVAALSRGGTLPAVIPTGAIPCSVAINPGTNTVYVSNYGGNSVTVIDAVNDRAIATVPAGNHPQAIALDTKRNLVFVANTHDNDVTVLDGATYAILATLPAGKNPYALAVIPGSARLYVANLDDPSFTIVDLRAVRNDAR
jgi:YVTN family beta-propeller protein